MSFLCCHFALFVFFLYLVPNVTCVSGFVIVDCPVSVLLSNIYLLVMHINYQYILNRYPIVFSQQYVLFFSTLCANRVVITCVQCITRFIVKYCDVLFVFRLRKFHTSVPLFSEDSVKHVVL